MTAKEVANAAGIGVPMIRSLKRTILTKDTDYYYEEKGNGSSLLRFTDSGVAKILGRNTLHYSEKSGRPKKELRQVQE